jgi:hypothetical protein
MASCELAPVRIWPSAISSIVLAVLLCTGTPVATRAAANCAMSEADTAWVQRALDGWELVRRDFLKLEDGPLPWIVLFDAACIWHLAPDVRLLPGGTPIDTSLTHAGRSVDVRALAHEGTVLLPNRVEVPAIVRASTALYRSGRAPFFSMSLPAVWRQDASHAKRPQLDDYLQGVMIHEMTHTRLLVAVNRRLRELLKGSALPPGLNDDVIQMEFKRAAGFERAIVRERDLFYQALEETDAARRATMTYRSLGLVRERHARYFTGPKSPYREVEGLFLTLEGVGQWAAYRLATARGRSEAEALKLVRDDRKYWSQDEGLALFTLIDALVPDWQARVFGHRRTQTDTDNSPAPPLPFDLLEHAILEQSKGARR